MLEPARAFADANAASCAALRRDTVLVNEILPGVQLLGLKKLRPVSVGGLIYPADKPNPTAPPTRAPTVPSASYIPESSIPYSLRIRFM